MKSFIESLEEIETRLIADVDDRMELVGTRNNIALMMDIAELELENLKFDEEQWGINPKRERKLRKIRDILRTML